MTAAQYLTAADVTDLIQAHTAQAIARLEYAGLDLTPVEDEPDEEFIEAWAKEQWDADNQPMPELI